MNKAIGIFDSGIGGLTVLKQIIQILPNEQYIYYADTNNVPYGTKPKEEVKKYIKEAVEFLIKKEVKALVIACNTATSIAISDLRQNYSIPIIGIEPAVKLAIENRGQKKVLVMATPITIKEEKLNKLVKKFDANKFVDLIAMPKLVEFAENRQFQTDEIKEYIEEQLREYNLEDYSELVLGCTHFPFFKKVFKEVFPKEIQIVDGTIGVAHRLRQVLKENRLLEQNKLKIEYYYSGIKVEENLDKLMDKI